MHELGRLFNNHLAWRDAYLNVRSVIEIRQAKIEFQNRRVSFTDRRLGDQFFAGLPFALGRRDDRTLDCRLAFVKEVVHQWQADDFSFFLGLEHLDPGVVHLDDNSFLDIGNRAG